MDSSSDSDDSSEMHSSRASTPVKERLKREVLMRKAKHHLIKYNNRKLTDRYWSGFFVVIFIIWIVSCQCVTHYGKDFTIFSEHSIDTTRTSELDYHDAETENTSVFVNHEANNEAISKNDITTDNDTMKPDVLLYWYLEVFTCNVHRLNELQNLFFASQTDDQKSNNNMDKWWIPLLLHMFVSVLLLSVSLSTFYADKLFCRQPTIIGATFFFVALVEHLLAVLYANNSITFSLLPSHEKLACWMVPETLFFIIWISKMYPKVTYYTKKLLDDFDDDEDSTDNYPLSLYKTTIIVGIPVFVILQLLAFYTMSILQNVTWGSTMFYVIIGGSFYVGFTIYYLGLMIVPCTMHMAVLSSQSPLKSSLNGLSTVLRYHFGTACYRATLIIPRIHSLFIMNDKKLKALSERLIVERFWMTHYTVHQYLATITATFGTNYSDSLKELLRFFSCDLMENSQLHNYRPMFRALLMFLLSINSLLIIVVWSFGLYDPQLSLATWTMYLKIMLIYGLSMAFFQATLDALDFDVMRKMLIEHNPNGSLMEAIAGLSFRGYYNEFQSSNSLADNM